MGIGWLRWDLEIKGGGVLRALKQGELAKWHDETR